MHRSTTLHWREVTKHLGVRVTTPARTAFDMSARLNDKALKVPDRLPPGYVTAVREQRRRSLRAAIDGLQRGAVGLHRGASLP